MRQSKRIALIALALCIGAISWGTLFAQNNEPADLTERFNSSSRRLDFFYPADWTVDDTDDNFISVKNDKLTIEFYNPELTKTLLELGGETLDSGLEFFISTLEFDEDAKTTTPVEFDDEKFIGSLVADGANGNYVLLLNSRVGDEDDQIFVRITGKTLDLLSGEALFLQIIKTVGNLIPVDGATTSNSNTGANNPPSTVEPAEPCFVFAKSLDGTSIHVGPGNNRTSIAFLQETELGYQVLGTANASDGTKWWRVDKTEAAPEKANVINEAWVADAEVDTSGGCDLVGTVKAPPIIRVRPTAAPTQAGNNSGTSPTQAPTPNPDSQELFVSFYADPSSIFEGECTSLFWDVRNAREVSYGGFSVSPQSFATECPMIDTTFTLEIVDSNGGSVQATTTVFVDPLFIECGFSDLPVFITTTLIAGDYDYWYFQLDPCESPMTIWVEMYSNDPNGFLDPFIDIYIDGSYVGSDDDGGGTPNAYIEVFVPAGSSYLEIYASDLSNTNGGSYDLLVERLN